MPYITINGSDIFYQEKGSGKNTIIFTHGVFFNSDICKKQMQHFSNNYRCIAFDWNGQGRSQKSLYNHDVDSLKKHSIEIMDKLDIEKAHWVGVSIGGVVGIRLAAEYSHRITSLCLMGATAEKETLEKLKKYETITESFFSNKELHADHLMKVLFGEKFRTQPHFQKAYKEAKDQLISNDSDSMRLALTPILRRTDIQHLLPQINCPTLVLVGEEDAANGPDRATVLSNSIKNSKMILLKNVGHTPTVEDPDHVNQLLNDFYSNI